MGRILGLVFVAAFVWLSAEVYTKGLDRAAGGLFAGEREAPEAVVRTQRASKAFQRAYDHSESRVDAALAKEP